MLVFALATAAALAAPHPGKLHAYKDWIVGCDNIRTCQANALIPEGDDNAYLMLEVMCDGTSSSSASLYVPLPTATPIGTRFMLAVDRVNVGTVIAQRYETGKAQLTRKLLDALASGKRLTLIDQHGSAQGSASLAGLAASLRFIDDQQRRAGTTAALNARGPKPDTATPPAPPLILAPPPPTKPPRTISLPLATRLIEPVETDCGDPEANVAPPAWRLDDAHSLILIKHPCEVRGHNAYYSAFILDETGPPRPAPFDDEATADNLSSADFDAKTRQLGISDLRDGLATCGMGASYVWDGARFRLIEQTDMDECRGSTDFIRTWTARTSR